MTEGIYARQLEARIESLERQIRLAVRASVGLGACLLASAFVAAQQPPNRVITASSFELRDNAGKTRATLKVDDVLGGAELVFLSDDRQFSVGVDHNGASMTSVLYGRDGKPSSGEFQLGSWGLALYGHGDKHDNAILLTAGDPRMSITDREGFETQIGASDLVVSASGKKTTTSAASIVLFDKDKHVLLSLPR